MDAKAPTPRKIDPRLRGSEVLLATYNVHAFVGRDGRRSPERILRVLRHIDASIVALQEVPCRSPALQDFADALGARAFVAPAAPGRDGFGNALLVRHELTVQDVRTHALTVGGLEPRVALEAVVEMALPAHPRLRVLTTHLGLRKSERRRQAQALTELVRHDALGCDATVLLGDVNAWERGAASIAPLLEHFHPALRPRSFPSGFPVLPLDVVFATPSLAVRALGAPHDPLARVASDHLPVVGVLDTAAL
jgi:endonuclease/exonuclease/phosphatase family metal-dependent hydrolase